MNERIPPPIYGGDRYTGKTVVVTDVEAGALERAADQIGALLLSGPAAHETYIMAHPESWRYVEARHDAVKAALEGATARETLAAREG